MIIGHILIFLWLNKKPEWEFGLNYNGGGGENRTRVQRTIDKKSYERSLCFIFSYHSTPIDRIGTILAPTFLCIIRSKLIQIACFLLHLQ